VPLAAENFTLQFGIMFDTLLSDTNPCTEVKQTKFAKFCDMFSIDSRCDSKKNLPYLAVKNDTITDMFFMNASRKYYFEKINFTTEWNAA
jgi:hypothetical protein